MSKFKETPESIAIGVVMVILGICFVAIVGWTIYAVGCVVVHGLTGCQL